MEKRLLAHYMFDDKTNVGKDSSGNSFDASSEGNIPVVVENVQGRSAACFAGGKNGSSYLRVPAGIFKEISDQNGITVTAWLNLGKNGSVWERIVDFGKGMTGPYMFLTRNLRGVCFNDGDMAAAPANAIPQHQWTHIAMTVSGTVGGTMSSAGPKVYMNGEIVADGSISQTTSGTYKKLQQWFAAIADEYTNNFIGRSQFDADDDFCGSLSDLRIYKGALTEDEISELMCQSFSDEDMVKLVADRYLEEPAVLAVTDYKLPENFLRGKVSAEWTSSNETALSNTGVVGVVERPEMVTLTVVLKRGEACAERSYTVTVLPKETIPYTVKVNAKDEKAKVSDTLWGLFYEDINNAADGGIYAEQIQNRSFENFHFKVYDSASGTEGKSSGRVREPLAYWFGDIDKCTPHFEGGLNEQLGIEDKDTCNCYISVESGTVISNRGFCDTNYYHSIVAKEGESFDLSLWARAKEDGTIKVYLRDSSGEMITNEAVINVKADDKFIKYGEQEKIRLTARANANTELVLEFGNAMDIEFVSLMPENVWGAENEDTSKTAHSNYLGNPNYRLRRDMVEALRDLHPTFLRFPGGCISEGSYIWENVYDWKESVGAVENRKENFNVWGYVMTMGLGYMEYFQLAEDLNATPLPVMACGVLCQARSDYANPAGGELQEKYINNFIDLIDFAISTDFDNNIWARLRKDMGHEAPFDLHYLGVGNENWGEEFMASFEIYYNRIMEHMAKNYPDHEFTIVSTVGAQADDDAYRLGWKFLAGFNSGETEVDFTDGVKSWTEKVNWYENKKHYMDTIADEHYYRPNEYLLNNADRYDYYYRAYDEQGNIDDSRSSKVFVGEYASTDKNTLAGAVAEAAVMTGFENNSDVVRLAATAPLFNKVLTDNQYRWTPDCIWFDNEKVWHTPTYYVQQMFAANIGKKVVSTELEMYKGCTKEKLTANGGISITTGNAVIAVKEVTVTGETGEIIYTENFAEGISDKWSFIKDSQLVGDKIYNTDSQNGIVIPATANGENGIVMLNEAWSRYKVTVKAERLEGTDGIYVGAGVTDLTVEKKNALQYVIGFNGDTTGIKVYKDGVEGYTLGDFSSSVCAGNLRSAQYEEIQSNEEYTIEFDYGAEKAEELKCSYRSADKNSTVISAKLNPYSKEIFRSATRDEDRLYIKLVNPNNTLRRTEVIIAGEQVKRADITMLSADMELVDVQNVNTKAEELVAPCKSEISFKDDKAIVELPAQSVAVIVAEFVK